MTSLAYEVPLGRRRDRAAWALPGFTVVELLVVLVILTLMLGILIPAVQSMRESGRIASCQNKLRQIGLAAATHETRMQHLPSNGWGYRWVGIDDRGYGLQQPGGWIFNLLPELELQAIRERFVLGSDGELPADLLQIPIPILLCPTRPYELSNHGSDNTPYVTPAITRATKTHFAINQGDDMPELPQMGPVDLSVSAEAEYEWTSPKLFNGVSHQRSRVRLANIRDGLSNTYLAGEKYVHINAYEYDPEGRRWDQGYDQSALSGADFDTGRFTFAPPYPDGDSNQHRAFGSAHVSGFSMVLCDGSVDLKSYSLDRKIHKSMGNIQDGSSE